MMPDMTEHVDRHITVAPYLLYFSKPYLRSVRRIGREVQGENIRLGLIPSILNI